MNKGNENYHHPLVAIAGFSSSANFLRKMAFAGYFMYSAENGNIIGGKIVNPLGYSSIYEGTFNQEGLRFKAEFKMGSDNWISSEFKLREEDGKYKGTFDNMISEGTIECILAMIDERAYVRTLEKK